MTAPQQRRATEHKHASDGDITDEDIRNDPSRSTDAVSANEESEGATGALETPATPPEMTKDGKVDTNDASDK